MLFEVALGHLGEHAAPAIPALCELLYDQDQGVRASAKDALTSRGERLRLQLLFKLGGTENIRKLVNFGC